MIWRLKNVLILLMFISSPAWADLDPELAAVGNDNEGGFVLGGSLSLGQAYPTDGSNPGLAYFLNVEPGYVAGRDSWGRIEASLRLAYGSLNFRDDSYKVEMNTLGILARIGYGWSLGHNMFSVIRIGAGPVSANYEAKGEGLTIKSDGAVSGIAGTLGYDLVMQVSDMIDVTGGLELMHIAADLDDVKVGALTASVDEPINLNLAMINIGLRLTF